MTNNSEKVLKETFAAGVRKGEQNMRAKALTFLEQKYKDPDVLRGSERGEAILELAKELSEALKIDD